MQIAKISPTNNPNSFPSRKKRVGEGGERGTGGGGREGTISEGLVSAIAVIELEISSGIGLGRKHEIR